MHIRLILYVTKMASGGFADSDNGTDKEKGMTRLLSLLIILLTVCCSCSYYQDITGKVVDNETGQPIEGALVVAQWTKPRGIPGLQHHELHKIVETITDHEGKFSLTGTSGYLLDPPEMIIYKEDYIPWRNDMVFPNLEKTKDNLWSNKETYKLDNSTFAAAKSC